jgi:hypothetical protein
VVASPVNFFGSGAPAGISGPRQGQVGQAQVGQAKDPFKDFRDSIAGKNPQELVSMLATLNTGIPKQGIQAGIVLQTLGAQVKSKGAMSPAGRDLIKSASVWLQGNPKAGIVLAALQDAVKG